MKPERLIGKPFNNGNYFIDGAIAKGGMAYVYHAVEVATKEQVAIKVLMNTSDTSIEMFQHEVAIMQKLAPHPHIMPAKNSGIEKDKPFLVMPYMSGGSVQKEMEMRPDSPLHPEQTKVYLTQTAEALQHGHNHNVAHNDIKPLNLLLQRRDHLVVSDYGTATKLNSRGGHLGGTVIAPERWQQLRSVAASDQYVLGFLAFRLVTGSWPFKEKDEALLLEAQLYEIPVFPAEVDGPMVDKLKPVILRMLEKKPEARYPSMNDFIKAYTSAYQDGLAEIEEKENNNKVIFDLAPGIHTASVIESVSIGGLIGSLPVVMEQPVQAPEINNHLLAEQYVLLGNQAISFSVGTAQSRQKPAENTIEVPYGESLGNADAYGYTSEVINLPDGRNQLIFVVADGIDNVGMGAGIYSSSAATAGVTEQTSNQSVIQEYVALTNDPQWQERSARELLTQALGKANVTLYENRMVQVSGKEVQTSTAATVFVLEEKNGLLEGTVGYVGNVRGYRKGKEKHMNLFTPFVFSTSEVIRNAAVVNPDSKRNVLYPNLGEHQTITPAISSESIQQGDSLVFLTDGIWANDQGSDTNIENILVANSSTQETVISLIRMVSNIVEDNKTALVIRVLSQEERYRLDENNLRIHLPGNEKVSDGFYTQQTSLDPNQLPRKFYEAPTIQGNNEEK